MNLPNLELYQILIIVNFIVSFILLAYGLYLASIEKGYRRKQEQLDTVASQIIQEANKKALNILKDSNYLSDTLRKEIDDKFDIILARLQEESKGFYKEIEIEYVKSTTKFAEDVEKRAEAELNELEAQVEGSAKNAQINFQNTYNNELNQAKLEISQYKKQVMDEFRTEISLKIKELSTELLPSHITIQDQEKLVSEIINRAYSEGVFKE